MAGGHGIISTDIIPALREASVHREAYRVRKTWCNKIFRFKVWRLVIRYIEREKQCGLTPEDKKYL